MRSPAFYDFGRWVADCPVPECTDAVAYYRTEADAERQERYVTPFRCDNGHSFNVDMPPADLEKRIVAALADRPEAMRRWYPDNHERAAEAGLPIGEKVADLKAETAGIVEREESVASEREALRAALEAAGVEIREDGTFGGRV